VFLFIFYDHSVIENQIMAMYLKCMHTLLADSSNHKKERERKRMRGRESVWQKCVEAGGWNNEQKSGRKLWKGKSNQEKGNERQKRENS